MDKTVLRSVMALAAVCFICCALPQARAQRTLLGTQWQAFLKDYRAGNYREALEIGKKLEEQAKTPNSGLKKGEPALILSSVAETLRALGQLKEAEAGFNEALKLCDAEPCALTKNAVLPDIYLDLPMIYEEEGRYAEAEAMWLQCVAKTKNVATFGYLPTNHLAKLYLGWGQLDKAKQYTLMAAEMCKKAPKTVAVPFSLYTTGMYMQNTGNYKKAEQSFELALSTCAEVNSKNHPYYAVILVQQAELFRLESRFADAEKSLNEALKIEQIVYPGDHPYTADTMVRMARVMSDEGRYAEGHEFVDKALKSYQSIFGSSDNIKIAKAKDCLGNILRQEGRYQEAQDAISAALTTEQQLVGKDNVDVAVTMRDLALVQEDQANTKEAESLFKDSLTIINQKTGPDHPERIAAANALAHFYLNVGRYDEAEPLLKQALALSQKVLGENNTVTANSARDLGQLYTKQKRYAEAQSNCETALKIDESLYGKSAPQVAADLMSIATVCGAQGKTADAEAALKRAAEIKNVLPGGGIASEVAANLGSNADRPVRDKWALVIGVSNFKDSTINLKYAAKDATDFRNFLVTSEKFKPDHTKLLTDGAADKQNILDMLGDKWLGRHVKNDDLVVVYVSSHGSQGQSEANGVNFLVAHDTNKNSLLATGIPMQWLTNIIKEQVHSDRVILILDVCHSGSAAEGSKGINRTTDVGLDPKLLKIGSGQMVICSSSKEQVSWESKNYENSVFTRKLMEALQLHKDKTTLIEAYNYLRTSVETEVLQDRGDLQTPQLMNKTWKGKDPVLAVDTAGPVKTTTK